MNDRIDEKSAHGACPVLRGTKYAANLWLWNGDKYAFLPSVVLMPYSIHAYSLHTPTPTHYTHTNPQVRSGRGPAAA